MNLGRLLFTAALPCFAASTIVPFPHFVGSNGFGSNATVSSTCQAALNSTINCDPSLQIWALSQQIISPNTTTIAGSLCASTCNSSLTSYQSNVIAQCGSSPVIDAEFPNTFMGQYLQDYYDLICTKESDTGKYCVDYLNTAWAAITTVSDFSQVPQDLLCSPCVVSFFTTLQSSPFWGYNLDLAADWAAGQKKCGLNLPLGVNPASNLTTGVGLPVVPPSGSPACASGNKTTVHTGDTCESIAVANSVSQGTLWAINNLTPNCSLMQVGQSLCLPKPCELYTLQPKDSCWSIATANDLSFAEIISFNPTINPTCTNLNTTGSVICISNPQGNYVPSPVSTTTVAADQTEYANSSVPAPGNTPFGTTTECGSWYRVQVADFCERISLSAAISVELFELINPSIDANCTNLVPDLWYCVQAVYGWNTTSSGNSSTSTITLPPPAPTPSGTTSSCFLWHVIATGDTCTLLEEVYGISMDELVSWNPNLASDCGNLDLGEAYCVEGPSSSTSVSTTSSSSAPAATKTTQAPPGPTLTGTTSTCYNWHVVVSGDGCWLIEQTYDITMDQLMLWNSNLNSDCGNLDLGEAYCVEGPSSSTSTSVPARTSTTQAPPGPTLSGTTGTCYNWHVVVSGDGCWLIEQTYDITMDQLMLWNSNLNSDCGNLDLGEAYCVAGPST